MQSEALWGCNSIGNNSRCAFLKIRLRQDCHPEDLNLFLLVGKYGWAFYLIPNRNRLHIGLHCFCYTCVAADRAVDAAEADVTKMISEVRIANCTTYKHRDCP